MEFFTFVYDYIFVLEIVAVCLSLLIVFYPFEKTVKSFLWAGLHFVILFAATTLLNWGLFSLSHVWNAIGGLNFHLSWMIIIVAYLCYSRQINLMSRIITGVTLCVVVSAMADLGRQTMNFISGSNAELINILFYVLMVMYSAFMRVFSLKNYSDIPAVSVILIMISDAFGLLLIIVKNVINTQSGSMGADLFYTLTLASIYVLAVSGYFNVYFHCKTRKRQIEVQVENKLLEADKQMLVVSEQAIAEMRQIRHDIKNQYKVIGMLLKEEKYGELKGYFSSMDESFLEESGSGFIDCGNSFVNSVINMEILKANKYGIQLMTKINIPAEMPFDKSDLCRILVNLLDNAIEAVLRLESRDYLIDCKMAQKGDYLYICVQNQIRENCDRQELLELNTEKEDTVNHGFGHRIVKRIAEKYCGIVKYEIEGYYFMAEVMLDFTSVKQKNEKGVMVDG
ncbi:MAG: GHKL domain-containing protein [Clostridia bacterium]|nr:GHKL domain-containing protein [Clostridia bacterium]